MPILRGGLVLGDAEATGDQQFLNVFFGLESLSSPACWITLGLLAGWLAPPAGTAGCWLLAAG